MSSRSAIVLAQERGSADHFPGVCEAINARGGRAERALTDEPLRLGPGDVLCVSDTRSFTAQYALRRARAAGACCVLLMDGIVEYRNTFRNPRSGAGFLRPAPVDVVACAGPNDAAILRQLGNDAVATGLPRLSALQALPPAAEPRALVATALQPYLDDDERRTLLDALTRIRDALVEAHIPIEWRLTGDLADDVAGAGSSVARAGRGESGSLHDALARASLVICSPSTLLVEAMLTGRPTAMLFPFDAPRWPRAPVTIDAAALADPAALLGAIGELANPPAGMGARQREALEQMHAPGDPAGNLADLLLEVSAAPRRRSHASVSLDPRRLPLRCRALPGRTRVVSLVRCDESPVGGVTVWSKRLARALAERNSRFDMRTLLVVTHPDSLPERSIDDDGLTQTCVLDPMADRWAALETLRASIARLQPEIICPNYADICYAAATLHRCAGARIVPIAHTDHESYRDLMAFYDHWEAAAGVSDACMQWLEPLAGDRPTRKIVYGVPVAGAPRTPAPDGPLRLAYIGRMVEPQKRISDLLAVIDGLERRAISYELHMVGDGVDLPAWRRRLAERTLRSGRVRLHGRCSPDEVQRLLADIDISLLVSDYEGASITMLEAMGAGVVPVVTRVGSGVGEWVTDGETGMVVDIGDTEAIADRLGQLAGDRALLGRLGRAAWERARSAISVDRMATQYEELFGAAMAQGRDTRPTDTGLRFIEHWTWRKNWCDEPEAARRWIRGRLGAAGFARVVEGRRVESVTPGSAVILSDDDPRAESLRARGVGVACAPSLHECEPAARLRRAVRAAAADGAERIAIYGLGLHTRRCAGLFLEGLPIAGIIDDDPPTWGSAYGVPVVTAARAPHDLRPDVVILSSDRFERQMWDRSAPLRAAGVPVIALYGSYDDAAVERTAVA